MNTIVNYELYRSDVGITNPDMTHAVAEEFPKFSKIQSVFINAPDKFGVCLVPEAEKLCVERFGYGRGLAFFPASEPEKKKKTENRTKGNPVTVRMDDELYLAAVSMKTNRSFPSMQALIEQALREFIERNTATGRHER